MTKKRHHSFLSLLIRICFSLTFYMFPLDILADDSGVIVPSVINPEPPLVKIDPSPDPIPTPAEPPPPILPELDQVVQGQLDISQKGTHMDMHQGREDTIANFNSFNIGEDHSVHVHQHPDTFAFFRVTNQTNISRIDGLFKADANILLVTPNGLLIGEKGVLDMRSVMLTTHTVSDDAFLNRSFTNTLSFDSPLNPDAIISNHGTIKTSGFAALVAPTVRNSGLIQGNIFVGAGNKADLSFAGSDLIQMRVSGKLKKSLIDQRSSGKLSAQGKKVVISASAVEEAANGVINLRGTIDASDGQIIVEGDNNTRLKVHGDLSVEGKTGKGGKIYLNAPVTHVEKTATLKASSKDHDGGDIRVFGEHIGIYGDKTLETTGATLDASGGTEGGLILVGGDKRGQGDEPRAKSLFVDYGTNMKADSTKSGDAGDIVLWSDTVTRMYGFNSASALGTTGGAGTIEWSGKKFLHFEQRPAFYPKLLNKNGKLGTIIIDPSEITVDSGSNPYNAGATGATIVGAQWIVDQISSSLSDSSWTNVDLVASDTITVNSPISTDKAGAALKMSVDRSISSVININQPITLDASNASMPGWGTIRPSGSSLLVSFLDAGNVNINAPITSDGSIKVASIQFATSAAGHLYTRRALLDYPEYQKITMDAQIINISGNLGAIDDFLTTDIVVSGSGLNLGSSTHQITIKGSTLSLAGTIALNAAITLGDGQYVEANNSSVFSGFGIKIDGAPLKLSNTFVGNDIELTMAAGKKAIFDSVQFREPAITINAGDLEIKNSTFEHHNMGTRIAIPSTSSSTITSSTLVDGGRLVINGTGTTITNLLAESGSYGTEIILNHSGSTTTITNITANGALKIISDAGNLLLDGAGIAANQSLRVYGNETATQTLKVKNISAIGGAEIDHFFVVGNSSHTDVIARNINIQAPISSQNSIISGKNVTAENITINTPNDYATISANSRLTLVGSIDLRAKEVGCVHGGSSLDWDTDLSALTSLHLEGTTAVNLWGLKGTISNFYLSAPQISFINELTFDARAGGSHVIKSPTPGGLITLGNFSSNVKMAFLKYENIDFTNQQLQGLDGTIGTLEITTDQSALTLPPINQAFKTIKIDANSSVYKMYLQEFPDTYNLYVGTNNSSPPNVQIGGNTAEEAFSLRNRDITINSKGSLTLKHIKEYASLDFNPLSDEDSDNSFWKIDLETDLATPGRDLDFHKSYLTFRDTASINARNIKLQGSFYIAYSDDVALTAENDLTLKLQIASSNKDANLKLTAGNTISFTEDSTYSTIYLNDLTLKAPTSITLGTGFWADNHLTLISSGNISVKKSLYAKTLFVKGHETDTNIIPNNFSVGSEGRLSIGSNITSTPTLIKAATINFEGAANATTTYGTGALIVGDNTPLRMEATTSLTYTGGAIITSLEGSPLVFKAPNLNPGFLANIAQASSVTLDTNTMTLSGTISPTATGLEDLILKTSDDLIVKGTIDLASGTLAFDAPVGQLKLQGDSVIGAGDVTMTSPLHVDGGPYDLTLKLKGGHEDRNLGDFINTTHQFKNLTVENDDAAGKFLMDANPNLTENMDLKGVKVPAGTALSTLATKTMALRDTKFTGGSVDTHGPVNIYGILSGNNNFGIETDGGDITFQAASSITDAASAAISLTASGNIILPEAISASAFSATGTNISAPSGSSITATTGGLTMDGTVLLNGTENTWTTNTGAINITDATFKTTAVADLTLTSAKAIASFNPSLVAGSVGAATFNFGDSETSLKTGDATNAIPLTLSGNNMRLADTFTYTSTAGAGLTLNGTLSASEGGKTLTLNPAGALTINGEIDDTAGHNFQTITLGGSSTDLTTNDIHATTTLNLNADTSGTFALTGPTIAIAANKKITATGASSLVGGDGNSVVTVTTAATLVNPENITFTNQKLKATTADTVTLDLKTDQISLILPPTTTDNAFSAVNVKLKTLSSMRTLAMNFTSIPYTNTLNVYKEDAEKALLNTGSTLTLSADLRSRPLAVNFPYTTTLSNLTSVSGLTMNSAWTDSPSTGERIVKITTDLTSNGTLDFKRSLVKASNDVKLKTTADDIKTDYLFSPASANGNVTLDAVGSVSMNQRANQSTSFGTVNLTGNSVALTSADSGAGLLAAKITAESSTALALTDQYNAPIVSLTGAGITTSSTRSSAFTSLSLKSTGANHMTISNDLTANTLTLDTSGDGNTGNIIINNSLYGNGTGPLTIKAGGGITALPAKLGDSGKVFTKAEIESANAFSVANPLSIYANDVSIKTTTADQNISITSSAFNIYGGGTGSAITLDSAGAITLLGTLGSSSNIFDSFIATSANAFTLATGNTLSIYAKDLSITTTGVLQDISIAGTLHAFGNGEGTISMTAGGTITNLPSTLGLEGVQQYKKIALQTANDFILTSALSVYTDDFSIKTTVGRFQNHGSLSALGTGSAGSKVTIDTADMLVFNAATTFGESDKLFDEVILKSSDQFNISGTLKAYAKKFSVDSTASHSYIYSDLTLAGDGTNSATLNLGGTLFFETGTIDADQYTNLTLKTTNNLLFRGGNINAPTVNIDFDTSPTVRLDVLTTNIKAKNLSLANGAGKIKSDSQLNPRSLTLELTEGTANASLDTLLDGAFDDLDVKAKNSFTVPNTLTVKGDLTAESTGGDLTVAHNGTNTQNIRFTTSSGHKTIITTSTLEAAGTLTIDGDLQINQGTTLKSALDMAVSGTTTSPSYDLVLNAPGRNISIGKTSVLSLQASSDTLTLGANISSSEYYIDTQNYMYLYPKLVLSNETYKFRSKGNFIQAYKMETSNATGTTLNFSANGTYIKPEIIGTNAITINIESGNLFLRNPAIVSTAPLTLQALTPIKVEENFTYAPTTAGASFSANKKLIPSNAGTTLTLKPQGMLTLMEGIGDNAGTRFQSVTLGNHTAQTVLSTAQPEAHVSVGGNVYGEAINVSDAYIRLTKDIEFNSSGPLTVTDVTQFEGTAADAQGLALTLNGDFVLPAMGNVHPLKSLTVNSGDGEIDFRAGRPIVINGDRTLISTGAIHLDNADASFVRDIGTLKISTNANVSLRDIGQDKAVTVLDLSGITGNVILGNATASNKIILPTNLDLQKSPTLIAPLIRFNNDAVDISGGSLTLKGGISVPTGTTFTGAPSNLRLGGSITADGGLLDIRVPLELLQDVYLKSDSIWLRGAISGHHGLTIEETAGFSFDHTIGTEANPLKFFEWRSSQSLAGRIQNALHTDSVKLWTPDMAFGPGLINTPLLHLIPTWAANVPSDQRIIAIQNTDYPFQIWRSTVQNPAYFNIATMILGDPNNRVPIIINNSIQTPDVYLILYGEPIYVGLGFDQPKNVEFRGTILRDKAHNDLWNGMQEMSADYDISPAEGALNSVTSAENMPMAIIPLGQTNKQAPVDALQDGEATQLVGANEDAQPIKNLGESTDSADSSDDDETKSKKTARAPQKIAMK